ncbi:MAG TPA: hypothetical protein VG992_02515 [Candidatus Saccharimonadales bacterium]|nr:hypothetical protein [Candidatus Saccharimonadales bacterium]
METVQTGVVDRIDLNHNAPYDVTRGEDHLRVVRRALICPLGDEVIVEYGNTYDLLPVTRHPDGLGRNMIENIKSLGRPVVAQLCEAHGGEPYRPLTKDRLNV